MRTSRAKKGRPKVGQAGQMDDRSEIDASARGEGSSQGKALPPTETFFEEAPREAGLVLGKPNVHPLSKSGRVRGFVSEKDRKKSSTYATSRKSKNNKKADVVSDSAGQSLELVKLNVIAQFRRAGFSEGASVEAAEAALARLEQECPDRRSAFEGNSGADADGDKLLKLPTPEQLDTPGYPPRYKGKRVDGDAVTFYRVHWLPYVEAQLLYQFRLRELDTKLFNGLANAVKNDKTLSVSDPTVMPPPKKKFTEDRASSADAPEVERVKASVALLARAYRATRQSDELTPTRAPSITC